MLFLVRRSTYVVYYRWRAVSEPWYDRFMNESSASSKKKPTPAIVAASMNAGRGRANGKSQRGDNRVGARRNDAVNEALAELDKHNKEMSERYTEWPPARTSALYC